MLTGRKIREAVECDEIHITAFNEKQLNPNSYNLRLGSIIYEIEPNSSVSNGSNLIQYIDPKKPAVSTKHIIGEDGFIIYPNRLYLGTTIEATHSKIYVPCISGRSSYARHGVEIHKTAGFGDIGFAGQWTLEISTDAYPFKLYAGMEICQIYFEECLGSTDISYSGKYQNQLGPQNSKSCLDKFIDV